MSTNSFLAEASTALVCTERRLFVRCVSHRGRGSCPCDMHVAQLVVLTPICACDFSIVNRNFVLSVMSLAPHVDTTGQFFTIDRSSSRSTHHTVQCTFSDKDRRDDWMDMLHCWLKTKNFFTWWWVSSHRQLCEALGETQLLRVAQQGLQRTGAAVENTIAAAAGAATTAGSSESRCAPKALGARGRPS